MEILLISDYEKRIYNCHLKITRSKAGKPYQLRKDFSNIDAATTNTLKKLSFFFKKHNHINIEDFFSAPYNLYNDETFYDLTYFNTLKAIKAYTTYKQSEQNLEPDNQQQLDNIKSSLRFILAFCNNNKIKIADYIRHTTGNLPTFILHLKEHKVNLYTLFGYPEFESIFKTSAPDILKFTLGEDIYNSFNNSKIKLSLSEKARHLICLGLKKLENYQNIA